jgi:S1-C subfamily serine protease/regulation of enolase protein 1 (concanavalin A-like superfamily)
MSTEFTCPYCSHTGRLPAAFAGGRVKCPSCRNTITVTPPERPVVPPQTPEIEPSPAAEPAPGEPARPAEAAVTAAPAPGLRTPEPGPDTVPVEPKVVPGDEDEDDEPAADATVPWRWVAAGVGLLMLALVGFVVVKVAGSHGPVPAAAPSPAPGLTAVAAGGGDTARPAGSLAQGVVPPGAVPPGTVPPGTVSPWGLRQGTAPQWPTPPGVAPPGIVATGIGPPAPATPPSLARATAPGVAPGGAVVPVNVVPTPASEAITRVNDATVYIKVEAGSVKASGTGFVVRVDGQTVYIATNDHVIRTSRNEEDDPGDPKAPTRITAVFRSGEPAGKEAALNAQIVAFDRAENRDLALLRVDGMANPPAPIDLAREARPTQAMPVLIHGFPLGPIPQMIDRTSHQNPTVTISRGAVSRFQNDDFGRLSFVQIDRQIDSGNSGGPVVDEQGRLVGVAVAKIIDSTISFAIPAVELRRMLDGRVGRLRLGLASESAGQVVLRARVGLIDPLERIRSVELLVGPDTGPSHVGSDGSWPQMGSGDRVPLERRGAVAEGTIQTRLTRRDNRNLKVQACVQDASGKMEFSKPESYAVPLQPSAPAIVGNGRGASGSPRSVGVLGALVDPSKTCKMSRDGDAVVIDVPAGIHLPGPVFASRPAPMVLADVEGDFAAQVRVTGALLPGTEPVKIKGLPLPNTFQGAGLMLFEDRHNYVRIERAGIAVPGRPAISYVVMVEVCDNGRIAGPFLHIVDEGPLYIRIERLHGGIHCMFGPNGNSWISHRQLATQFPKKVKVGLIASNASKEPLSARFEGFSLSIPQSGSP